MYDHPATMRANDQYWNAIRKSLGYGPASLTRNMDVWDIWQSPELLLAQTCGFPFRARLHDHVTLIGTPDYGLHNCPAGYYNSVFVSRCDDPRSNLAAFRGATFAYNDPMSQSGWASPMQHLAESGINFAKHIPSGSHSNSARMVADQRADIAAIDAVTWAILAKCDSYIKRLHVIDHTEPTPGLPYITTKGRDKAALFAAIRAAINTLAESQRFNLHLKGIVDIPVVDYLALPSAPSPDTWG